ncbi:transcriptional regulator, LuxR family [Actinobacteria bacterium OK074]|nr:transcriptional regulator, LuxR family [Actinobacteria bacterium OK074]
MSGPVATGKTELLHSFAEKTLKAGALVMSATASRSERALRFEVLAQLFQPIAQDPEHRAQVERLLNSDACTTVFSDQPAEVTEKAYFQVFHTLWMLLAREMSQRPVVVLVDDVQYADESSVRGLLFLARRLKFARVLMVFTEQTGPHHQQHSLFHADLFRQPHCRRLRLTPLTAHGVAKMLGEKMGAEEARALAPEFLDATGGNPLLVRALADDRIDAAPLSTPAAEGQFGGDAFGEALISCLHRLEPPALNVATAAAVLGRSSTPELVAALLGVDSEAVRYCGEILNLTGVLSGWRFRHRAAEPAVLSRISPEERRDLHNRAAVVLHQDAAPRETVSRHLMAAGAPLPEWSVEVLRETASEALFSERIEDAIQYLELARETCSDARKRGTITALLTVLEWRSDPSTASRRFPLLGAILRQGQLSQRDAGTFLRLLLWHGSVTEAEEILEQFAELPAPDDPASVAEMRFLWTWLAHSYPWLAQRFKLVAGVQSVTAAAVTADPQCQAADVLATALSDDIGEAVTSQAEQLLEGLPLNDSTLEPLTTVLTTLVYADRSRLAARWCDSLLSQATARRAPTWQAVLSSNRGEIALRQGDLLLAREHAHSALTYVSLERWGMSSGSPLSVLLRAATEMGDLGEAARVVRQPVSPAVLEARFGLHYLQARGHYYLARGWSHTARNDFHLCGELVTQWGIDVPGLVLWRLDLAEAYLQLGQPDRARVLAQEQLERTSERHARAHGMALRVLAAAGSQAGRPQLLTESVQALTESDDRLELARATTDLAHAHETLGDTARAQEAARQARDLAILCHAEPLVQRAVLIQEYQPVGLPTGNMIDERDSDPITVLSDSERRVAALAARGHTNRQIARRLFITVSTVEQHLTSTYRKLKVNKRADLPSDLELIPVDSA